MSKDDALKWETLDDEQILHTPVFDVRKQHKRAADGLEGDYVEIRAPEWIVIVAVHDGKFVLVRQWRHGLSKITLEFPAGVADPGEDPAQTALRELEEETGFRAGKVTCLGRVSSNPALFSNYVNVYLAEELTQTGRQHLDADERIRYEELPIEDVIDRYGDEELTHAYMGTALALYIRQRMR